MSVPSIMDSNGGMLSLQGAEMLMSDASLFGKAGGPTAHGGSLSVFSGRYYVAGASRTSADINLLVTQSGNILSGAPSSRGIGITVHDSSGNLVSGMGYFSANRFKDGEFASLDLGYKYLEDAAPIPYGGNVEFSGSVSISASGSLRVAGGGIIKANSDISLYASYIAVGQPYRAPLHPNDGAFVAFSQDPPPTAGGPAYNPVPTYGSGKISFSAPLIDIGTTVFQNTGKVTFTADSGDIRGNGVLNLAGDLTLTAGQIYPTTLATFSVFAYDHSGIFGSVNINQSGIRPVPYSAGGNLNVFASNIVQGGTMRAPFGSIILGWDGTDFDPSTTAIDSPTNAVLGTAIAVPVTKTVTLTATSTTAVSAVDPATGKGLIIPYGITPDGLSWVDPRGVTVTVSGLPQKRIVVAGNSVSTEGGSVIDLRGGGDLFAYRWVSGTGGSNNLLDTPAAAWGAGKSYKAGDLVSFNGQVWSARVAIDPATDSTSRTPSSNDIYWSQLPDSYAVLPDYDTNYAPYAVNNTGSNASLLGGNPGLTSANLKLGDRIYLDTSSVLKAGYYTLLPKQYALLP